MSYRSSSQPALRADDPSEALSASPMAWAILAHALIWTVVPSIFLGNLYPDTLSAAYWRRDSAMGYYLHPPITSWVLDAVLRIGHAPIFSVLLTAQITVAISAFFVWKTARLYASTQTAALAVLLYLASPMATIFTVNLNHNSMLEPFWTASLYFMLAYLERGRWRDAIALGVAVGLAALTKYEVAFLVVCGLALAVAVPRFRVAFARPASYVAVLIALAILAPNLYWEHKTGWTAIGHATGLHRLDSMRALRAGSLRFLISLVVLFLIPAIVLAVTSRIRVPDAVLAPVRSRRTLGLVLAFGPLLVLVCGSLISNQVLKPLWPLCMTSSGAVGLALLFPAGSYERGWGEHALAKTAAALSAALLVLFVAYLIAGELLRKPAAFYAADSRKLSRAVDSLWHAHQPGPLRCIVTAETVIGGSPTLWLRDRPRFVNFIEVYGTRPEQIAACTRAGAIAILGAGPNILAPFPNACPATLRTVQMPTVLNLRGYTWPVRMLYIAPEGQTCQAT